VTELSPPDDLRASAIAAFGELLPDVQRYADLLATEGVVRGLIGPREAPRLWGRHLLNCAVIAPLIPESASVIDVGSGAGLPGIVLALARPDLLLTLVEPLGRRVTFLDEIVDELDLAARVTVVRARAEEVATDAAMFHVKHADVVTARAVAPLDRLAGWCLPLCAVGGRVLAMKGSSAESEAVEHARVVERLGGSTPVVRRCEAEGIDPTYVIEIVRERVPASRTAKGRSRRR